MLLKTQKKPLYCFQGSNSHVFPLSNSTWKREVLKLASMKNENKRLNLQPWAKFQGNQAQESQIEWENFHSLLPLNSLGTDRSKCVPPSTGNASCTPTIIHCYLHWQISIVAVTQTQLHTHIHTHTHKETTIWLCQCIICPVFCKPVESQGFDMSMFKHIFKLIFLYLTLNNCISSWTVCKGT